MSIRNQRFSVLKQPLFSTLNQHLIDYPTPSNISYWWGFGSLAGISGTKRSFVSLSLASTMELANERNGVYEDHPGLNPSDEAVVQRQALIRERLEELTGEPGRSQILAEALHAETDNIEFMDWIIADLQTNGVASESYREALELIGEVGPSSPLDQFAILPWIDMKLGNLYFSFTNSSFFMLLTLTLVLLLLHFVTKKGGGNSVPKAILGRASLFFRAQPGKRTNRRSFWKC